MPNLDRETNEILLTLDVVMQITGFSKAHIYRSIARPEVAFPKPIKFGRASRWAQSQVQSWIKAQVEAAAA